MKPRLPGHELAALRGGACRSAALTLLHLHLKANASRAHCALRGLLVLFKMFAARGLGCLTRSMLAVKHATAAGV